MGYFCAEEYIAKSGGAEGIRTLDLPGFTGTRSPSARIRLALLDVNGKHHVKSGGAEGIRTLDLLDAIEARSQLRHGPTGNDVNMLTPQKRARPDRREDAFKRGQELKRAAGD